PARRPGRRHRLPRPTPSPARSRRAIPRAARSARPRRRGGSRLGGLPRTLPQGYEARLGEDKALIARPVGEVFPQSPQEIARDRHADLLREATRQRLAASIREGTETERPLRVHAGALRLTAGVGR